MEGPLDDQEETRALRLLKSGRALLDLARATIEHSDLFRSAYVISYRLKREPRIYEKVRQKIADGKAGYRVSSLTDIVGIRFITLYREDVANVVAAFLDLVTGKNKTKPNHLYPSDLAEFIVYVSNVLPESDPLTSELKAIYAGAFEGKAKPDLKSVVSRYSSVHMVLWIEHHEDKNVIRVPIEIQFRCVFEDAWAEIDHQLYYEIGREGHSLDPASREVIAQHMGVLKRIMDAAAEHADVIRRTLLKAPPQPVTIQRNLDNLGYLANIVDQSDAISFIKEDLLALVAEKEALDAAIENEARVATRQNYVQIADRMNELMSRVDSVLQSTKP